MRFTSGLRAGILTIATGGSALWLLAQPQEVKPQEPLRKEAPVAETKWLPARSAPTEYQAQAKAGPVTIAADFVGHSVPTRDGTYSTKDFVAIEVAVFGPPETRTKLALEDFSLRLGGKKTALPSQPFELVRRTLEDPEWAPPTKAEKPKSSLGTGGGQEAAPAPVHMPMELRLAMEQRAQSAAMLQGERTLPQAGLLFFEYRGKTQSLRSLELVYNGAAGNATLALQP